jgi:hypothetical protein
MIFYSYVYWESNGLTHWLTHWLLYGTLIINFVSKGGNWLKVIMAIPFRNGAVCYEWGIMPQISNVTLSRSIFVTSCKYKVIIK